VTTEEDLEIIFSRFGNITSCDIIRCAMGATRRLTVHSPAAHRPQTAGLGMHHAAAFPGS